MEGLYRIYSPRRTRSGEKIPNLSQDKLSKLTKNIKKSKSISFYIEQYVADRKKPILLEIDHTGNITFTIEKLNKIKLHDIENTVKSTLNTFIGAFDYIDQKGVIFNYFKSFEDSDKYKIIDISYRYDFKSENQLDTERSRKCFMPFFTVIEDTTNFVKL